MEPARPAAPCCHTGLCHHRHHGHRGMARLGERVAAQGTPVLAQDLCRQHKTPHSPPTIVFLFP